MSTNLLWLDSNIDNKENSSFLKVLSSISSLKIKKFKNVNEAIKCMKGIKYEETKVIVSGRLYPDLIQQIKENIKEMRIAPKIIVFTGNKAKFLEYNKDYYNINNNFYNFGGIASQFDEIQNFLKSDFRPKNLIKSDENQFIFEYIDSQEKLDMPKFYKKLLENTSIDDSEEYTNYLYNFYSKDNSNIKQLLDQIKLMSNIPIEILARYYGRLYTCESRFYVDLNKDLKSNKIEKHLKYIKILYEGVKLKSFPPISKNVLYGGLKISNVELNKILTFMKNISKDSISPIICAKSFLTFSQDKNVAEHFLSYGNTNKDFSNVFFILEIDKKLDYNLLTYCDLTSESYFAQEKEVLFFPFSFFEIKDVKERLIGKIKAYEIKLLYLGKYLKEI